MFESSSKNRKSWNRRQMVWQWIPNTWSNRWKWFGSCHGGFTWRSAYWERGRRAECSRRHISWDERWKIGWLLRLEHSESNSGNFETNSVANRKPMQLRENRRNVAEPRFLCDNSSKSILNTLKEINYYMFARILRTFPYGNICLSPEWCIRGIKFCLFWLPNIPFTSIC